MDNLNQKKKLAVSTGHEVHICLRCGWPFPNSHPSSRHRRAHKRVCGTIEGYEIYHSQSDNQHVVVSDEDHASDDDQHTPEPITEKKNAKEFGSSSGLGGKSNRSEDDVYADAVTDFSDSGISPLQDKSMEQMTAAIDLEGSELKHDDDETDITEQLSELTTSSDQMCTPVAPANETKQFESVVFLTDTRVEPISEILMDESIDNTKTDTDKEMQESLMKAGRDEVIQGEEDSPILILEPKEGKISGSALVSPERNEGLSETPDSEIIKVDSFPISEEFEYKNAATDYTPTKCIDVVSSVSYTEKKSEQKSKLGGLEDAGNTDLGEGEKYSGNKSQNQSQETEDNSFAKIVSFAPEVTQKEFVNHSDEDGKERGQVAATEVHFEEVSSTKVPISCEVDSEARNLEKVAKNEAKSLESLQELDKCMVTEVLQELDHEISHPLLLPVILSNGADDVKGVEYVDAATVTPDSKHNGDIVAVERTPEYAFSKDSAPSFTDLEVLPNTDTTQVAIELNQDVRGEVLSEHSESPTLEVQQESVLLNETSPECKVGHTNEGATTSKPIDTTLGGEETYKASAVTFTPISEQSALDFHVLGDMSAINDSIVGNNSINSKSLQVESGDDLTKDESFTATKLSGNIAEKCRSVSDTHKTNLQTTTEEGLPLKSDVFPLIDEVSLASEIETVQNNQVLNSDVVNKKKNEDAKVVNSRQGKQHIPLKNLLSEAKSPNTTQVHVGNEKDGGKSKVNGAVVTTVNNELEKEWDSPARHPIEIKKEKKKGRPFWVPFACCSSVH